ncbi:tannase subunit [Seiridium cupressi]
MVLEDLMSGLIQRDVYENVSWTITNPNSNGEWVTKFLNWQNVSSLDLTSVTSDDLKKSMVYGIDKYMNSLQTTLPYLSPVLEKGDRPMHFHGEAGIRIPLKAECSTGREYTPGVASTESSFSAQLPHNGTNPQTSNGTVGIEARLGLQYAAALGRPANIQFFSVGSNAATIESNGTMVVSQDSTKQAMF